MTNPLTELIREIDGQHKAFAEVEWTPANNVEKREMLVRLGGLISTNWPAIRTALQVPAEPREPLFLIIAGGDGGGQQKFVYGYEPAARAAFKFVIHGEPEDDDNNDYDVAIYDAVKDPDSEEWNDAGPQGIVIEFEDGFLQITRIETNVPEGAGWRPEVRAFADLMEAKLRDKDAAYGGNSWKKDYPSELFEKIREKYAEARRHDKRRQIAQARISNDIGDVETEKYVEDIEQGHIADQVVHLANYAMMIADVCGALNLKEHSHE